MADLSAQIGKRVADVQARIAAAAERAARDPGAVTLVAVTKSFPAEAVLAAYDAGLRHFGENRVGELAEKRAEVEAALGMESGIVWHLIGPLQSRKTTPAADHADYFHALDRRKIARRLGSRLEENERRLPTLLEVNVSGEESKHGFDATRWETDAQQQQALEEVARYCATLPGLDVRGLMTMAPWGAPEEEVRRVFARTRDLAAWLAEATAGVPGLSWHALSMGMTDDFELAVEAGATHVRVGRALFGERR